MSEVDLSVSIGALKLRNPILLASGTVGYGSEIAEFVDLNKIGGIVTKSLSLNREKEILLKEWLRPHPEC